MQSIDALGVAKQGEIMNKESNNANDSQSAVIASSIGGATVVGGLATIGTGASLAVVAAPIATPLVIALGVGYAVSEVWNWLRS